MSAVVNCFEPLLVETTFGALLIVPGSNAVLDLALLEFADQYFVLGKLRTFQTCNF